jgi:hypothetical protein
MAKKTSKAKARKRVATKDLAPKSVTSVKGGQRKAGGGQQDYMIVKLNDALITSV